MASVVLDTSALLAFIQGERGGEVVAGAIGEALMSAVNFAEAISKLVQRGRSLESALEILGIAMPDIIVFDRALAERAGGLIEHTHRLGLSLGDRACLALAAREGVAVLTADRAWTELEIGIDIRLIR